MHLLLLDVVVILLINGLLAEWEPEALALNLSINFLELYAVTVAVLLWGKHFANQKITLFCDNTSVVHMINNNTSKCANCLKLIRLIMFESLVNNRSIKVTAKHVSGVRNIYADLLSRLKYDKFRETARVYNKRFRGRPCQIPDCMWPVSKLFGSCDATGSLATKRTKDLSEMT